MTSPTVPPRYAFRLEDLRVFHLVRVTLAAVTCRRVGAARLIARPSGNVLFCAGK